MPFVSQQLKLFSQQLSLLIIILDTPRQTVFFCLIKFKENRDSAHLQNPKTWFLCDKTTITGIHFILLKVIIMQITFKQNPKGYQVTILNETSILICKNLLNSRQFIVFIYKPFNRLYLGFSKTWRWLKNSLFTKYTGQKQKINLRSWLKSLLQIFGPKIRGPITDISQLLEQQAVQ